MQFVKYQGTGNDFILIDGRNLNNFNYDIEALCNRHFGIGADGLMILKNHPDYDFEMEYYNSDGKTSSMCGNGGRCIVQFAHSLNLSHNNKVQFIAVDGLHEAFIQNEIVELGMIDVTKVEERSSEVFVLNTGSPHYVQYSNESVFRDNFIPEARQIRYNEEFKARGINYNLVNETGPSSLLMRTYERGVEDETLSCGTGVTAAALSYLFKHRITGENLRVEVKTKGGDLYVTADSKNNHFYNVTLCGPAIKVFEGSF